MPSSAWVGRRGPANRVPTWQPQAVQQAVHLAADASTAATTSDAVTAPVPGAPVRLEGVLTTPSSTARVTGGHDSMLASRSRG